MRQWLDLIENVNVITVYHGDQKPNVALHPKMFFTTDRDFASFYGPYVTEYRLTQIHLIDSLDPELIEPWLPLYDPYSDSEITTISDYMDRSSDTWEILECDGLADTLVSYADASGIIIYEGGVKNFLIYDTKVVQPVKELVEALTPEDAFLADPFVRAWDEKARQMGSDPVAKDAYGAYGWHGLEWHVFLRPYGTWSPGNHKVEIQHIQVVPQRQGIGQKLMTTLCALADQYGVPLILMADETNDVVGDDDDDEEDFADYDEREHWLQTWYSSLGFDYTGDTGDYGPYMEREPR